MTPPYSARIVALYNNEPFELARFPRAPFPSAVRYYTLGLEVPWWIERTMSDHETITSRPVIKDINKRPGLDFRVRGKELQRLENEGLEPEFKNESL